MTEFLALDEGTLAYDIAGSGPLVVLAHGMGDSREAFRFIAPALVAAGYRVASVDLRGCGESSVDWPTYTRTAIAGDLLALVRHLGGPAVLVGHSIAGGAVSIAAADAPELVTAVVELGPFTRKQKIRLGDFGVARYRRGALHLIGTTTLGSTGQWAKYLDVAYPGAKPADWSARLTEITTSLEQPGRMKVLQKMGSLPPVDAGEALPRVTRPVLVIQGSDDPDWVSPRAEGEAILSDLPAGLGQLTVIEGAGHYPHVEAPHETLEAMLPFLSTIAPTRNGSHA